MAECPVCGGEVELEGDAVVGELVPCPECGSELEVLEPIQRSSVNSSMDVAPPKRP